ncbi:MAG: hypothetical protein KKA55_07405 [Proteobacteria bacterium]|nr:hypothetical protein [Pseudomonadota bacterium]MBU1595346.1 hypothetical protein [Pseudomonadota bacterium]
MRRILIILTLVSTLYAPALAGVSQKSKDVPRVEDVLTYIDLFGYREMMEISVDHQLREIVDYVRTQRGEVPPRSLDIIEQELRRELKAATTRSLRDMAAVFQRHLTQADVDYLIGVGRDPRMRKVVQLQPKLAVELESVGEGLAKDVYQRAMPRIEERLKQLEGGEQL